MYVADANRISGIQEAALSFSAVNLYPTEGIQITNGEDTLAEFERGVLERHLPAREDDVRLSSSADEYLRERKIL
jgi:hypothetical protein